MPKKGKIPDRKKALVKRERERERTRRLRQEQQHSKLCPGLKEPVLLWEKSDTGTVEPVPLREESSVSMDSHLSHGGLPALLTDVQGIRLRSDSPHTGDCTPLRVPPPKGGAGQINRKNGNPNELLNKTATEIENDIQSEIQNKTFHFIPGLKECTRTLNMPRIENQMPLFPQVNKVNFDEFNVNALTCEQDENKQGNMHGLSTTESLINLTSNCIQGSFCQGNVNLFSNNSGKQCVANCLSAILFSKLKDTSKWTSQDLDSILVHGNELYTSLHQFTGIKHEYLLTTELPAKVEMYGSVFENILEQPFAGLLTGNSTTANSSHFPNFHVALSNTLKSTNACFATFCDSTVAIMTDGRKLYFFDSHSRDHLGMISEYGTSVLIQFKDISHLVKHCQKLARYMKNNLDVQYEITGITSVVKHYSKDCNVALKSDKHDDVIITNATEAEQNTFHEHNVALNTDKQNDVIITNITESEKFTFQPLSLYEKKTICAQLQFPCVHIDKSSSLPIPVSVPTEIKTITADGNCFFRAVSWSLTCTENYHQQLRTLAVKHILKNSRVFDTYIPQEFKNVEKYLTVSRMSEPSVWATEVEIKAISDILQLNIFVYSNSRWLKVHPFQSVSYSGALYLNHKQETHYDVVLSVNSEPFECSHGSNHLISDEYEDKLQCGIDVYFKDQAQRQLLKQSKSDVSESVNTYHSRLEYMRKYMQSYRSGPKKGYLQEKDRCRKTEESKKNRKKHRLENLCNKKMAREKNPERSRSVDLCSKRKARTESPEKFRCIDLSSKKNARTKNPQKFRCIDLRSKKKARTENLERFRCIDLRSKKKARTENPERFRSIDLCSKKKARTENLERFRSIDLKSKKKARTENLERFRSIDLRSKKKARTENCEQFRSIDLKSKKKARTENRDRFRSIDLKSKKKARTENLDRFRSIDLASKRKARRVNPGKLRAVDLASKQRSRCDPIFSQSECVATRKRMRRLRVQDEFVENERLKKLKKNEQCKTAKKTQSVEKNTAAEQKTPKENFFENSLIENRQYEHTRNNSSLNDIVNLFESKTSSGPIYVCTCCQQTWFQENVRECKSILTPSQHLEFGTGYKSVNGKEWMCLTCVENIKRGKTPKLSLKNGMKWPVKPPELDLHPLEERLVALRIPYVQIRELPRGGQYSAKGNVVNVPVDIQPVINALPRQINDSCTIAVKIKKKMSYKSSVFSENVRPTAVITALNWLMRNSDLYKNSGITVDEEWFNRTTQSGDGLVKEFLIGSGMCDLASENVGSEQESETYEDSRMSNNDGNNSVNSKEDTFLEVQDDDGIQGNSDTLVEDCDVDTNKTLVFAPGEGQRPLSLFFDKDAEVLSFPTIFCGQKRIDNDQRQLPVAYSDIAKWELRSVDRRAANSVPNIFLKLNIIQRKQVADKVSLAVRRKKNEGKKITAEQARNPETAKKIVNLDEGYYIFRTLRNSPAYLSARKKDVFAMIRQIGLPTWFMSLSSADTRWEPLLMSLAQLSGRSVSLEDITNMTWTEKAKLVQKDPVTSCRYFDHRVQVFINTVLKSIHSPIGPVSDTFQRVEFQNRGSPHVHMLIWTENAPKYNVNSVEEITTYVDAYITCSRDVDDQLKDLVERQIHKHSKTCKKGGKDVCRFGFPLPPLRKTMVLEPLDENVEEYKKKYATMHARMNDFKDGCDMSYDEFLVEIAQMNETEYINCIRSSLRGPKVFLKRQPSEMRVNYYNATILLAWKANIDLQFVLDPYACAMYIVSYISKSQRGMSSMLEQAAKEAASGNMDLKKQVRHIGNKFLNFVEISAQEAAYLVLQMPLTRASRDVIFINTTPPDQRVFLLKSQEQLDQLPANSTDIESDNILKRYSRRPKKLEHYCLADYVAELSIKNEGKAKPTNCGNDTGNSVTGEIESESDSDCDSEFGETNRILTLPNGMVIRKRKKQRVIRYVRYSKETNIENFCREKLLLFMPWRNEKRDLMNGYNSYQEHFDKKIDHLLPVILKYEHYNDELDTAQRHAEDEMSEFDRVAPIGEQVQAEDAEQSIDFAEEFVHYIPPTPEQGILDIGQDLQLPETSTAVEIRSALLPEDEFLMLMQSLNNRQREFFNHALYWLTTKKEPLYAFLSGGAGVGKSVLIRALYQALHRHLNSNAGDDPDSIKILLTAFTGKAAYNINGSTIASAFHKKMFQSQQHMHCDELNTFRTTYKDLRVVIIDEISMVGNKTLAFIHQRLMELTGTNQDFGGISIIAVGDLYQLSPVADAWIFNDMPISLAKNLWKEHFQMYELFDIMRQKDDMPFAELLNRLRVNQLTEADYAVIRSHTIQPHSSNSLETALHLFTENKKVDAFNNEVIQKLESTKVLIPADTDIVAPANISKQSKAYLIDMVNQKDKHSDTGNLPSILKAAVGMAYDITVNIDVQDGLTNGASGTLMYIEYKDNSQKRPAILWVHFSDIHIGKKTRTAYKHLYSKNIDNMWTPVFETKRTFLYNRKTYERIQFPLSPAAAKTVHKAQGTTVDELVVDLSSSFRAPHIHYVALSRVRSIANLHILDFNEKALKVDEKVHKEMERLRSIPFTLCYNPLYTVQNSFKLLFHNARSLHKHMADAKNDPNIQSAHIIGMCETRFLIGEHSEQYQLLGFAMYRADELMFTPGRPYHGLVLYVKHGITVKSFTKYSDNGLEFILATVCIKTVPHIQIVIVYKKPNLSIGQLITLFKQKLIPPIDCTQPLFILGDFNINLFKTNSPIIEFMQKHFLCNQIVTSPTTVHHTCLDHIYTNQTSVETGVIPAYWSDHNMVVCAKNF